MSPAGFGLDAALAALGRLASVPGLVPPRSSAAILAFVDSRPVLVAIGWTLLTLAVGAVLLAGRPATARAVRDETFERPDLAFAMGFLALFAPLVAVTLPLFVSMYVDHPTVLAVSAFVALPGLLLSALTVLVGGCFGAVFLGDRLAALAGRDSPSLRNGLVIGAVVIGSSQLVPVLGSVVVIGTAAVGIGGLARRRVVPWNDSRREHTDGERDEEPTKMETETAVAGASGTDRP